MPRKTPFLIVASCLVLTLFSCVMPITLGEGEFFAQRIDNNDFYIAESVLMAENSRTRVYVERGFTTLVGPAEAQEIAAEFANVIYPRVTSVFGSESDVDDNGKVTILILDIKDSYNPPFAPSYVAGYFNSRNLLRTRYSNQQEILYMDCLPGAPTSNEFYETLAHEFQHLINFNQNVFLEGNSPGQDTWINEGLSNAAEYVYRESQITAKINHYSSDPSGRIAKGVSFLSWYGLYENYAAGYLFFQWLRSHAADDVGIYRRIINDNDNDYRAVLDQIRAAQSSWPAPVPANWAEVVRTWYVANLQPEGTAPYGYDTEFTSALSPLWAPPYLSDLTSYSSNFPLAPSEAVYFAIAGSATMTPSGTIDYVGWSGGALDLTSPYDGTTLIAYNWDGNQEGAAQDTDALPSAGWVARQPASASAPPSRSLAGNPALPVDALFDSSSEDPSRRLYSK